jgi:hypothetical protein
MDAIRGMQEFAADSNGEKALLNEINLLQRARESVIVTMIEEWTPVTLNEIGLTPLGTTKPEAHHG